MLFAMLNTTFWDHLLRSLDARVGDEGDRGDGRGWGGIGACGHGKINGRNSFRTPASAGSLDCLSPPQSPMMGGGEMQDGGMVGTGGGKMRDGEMGRMGGA